MGGGGAQLPLLCVIVQGMTEVPVWFRRVSSVFAVVLSIWVGLHYASARPVGWMAIYGEAAIISALLPVNRLVGLIGLGVALCVAGGGAYLMKDAWSAISFDDVVSGTIVPINPGREAVALVGTTLWLVIASAMRARQTDAAF
jgi:hypothetical protein